MPQDQTSSFLLGELSRRHRGQRRKGKRGLGGGGARGWEEGREDCATPLWQDSPRRICPVLLGPLLRKSLVPTRWGMAVRRGASLDRSRPQRVPGSFYPWLRMSDGLKGPVGAGGSGFTCLAPSLSLPPRGDSPPGNYALVNQLTWRHDSRRPGAFSLERTFSSLTPSPSHTPRPQHVIASVWKFLGHESQRGRTTPLGQGQGTVSIRKYRSPRSRGEGERFPGKWPRQHRPSVPRGQRL